jgi:signal transduction histidine kinase
MRYHDDPERALAALEAIEGVARKTAADIDRIIGALRDRETDDAVEAPIGLASLGGLIDQHADAGLDITYTTFGCTRAVNRPVDQAAYRILQEALTNASRHGAGTAHVETDYGPTMLELRVTNPVDKQHSAASTTGHGLVGMQERAAALGGDVEIDRSNGTFLIRARLPYGATRQ